MGPAAVMTDAAPMDEDLDGSVRRVDPARWAASRFIAEPQARADVIVLYAFDHELERAARHVREPLMGEIRLTWWAEAVEAMAVAQQPVRRHPVSLALADGVRRHGLPTALLAAMVEARFADLDPAPLADAAALEAYLDGAFVAPCALAATLLGAGTDLAALRPAAQAYGLSRLASDRGGKLPPGLFADGGAVKRRIGALLDAANRDPAPPQAFPAVAHAALSRIGGRAPGALEIQLRLTLAVARGRL